MPRDRLPGGKGWGPQLVERDLSINPPGPITRRFEAPAKEEPSMAQDTQPTQTPVKEPTPHQVHVWNTVQRVGTVAAAAKELGMLHSGVTSALAGYMKNKGLKGPIPGVGGRVAGEADEQPSIGVIRPGRVIPAADPRPVDPGPSFSDVDKPEDDVAPEVSARKDDDVATTVIPGPGEDGYALNDEAEAAWRLEHPGESSDDHPEPVSRWSATVMDADGEAIGQAWSDGMRAGARSIDLGRLRRSMAAARSDRVQDLHPIVLGSIEWMAEHAGEWTSEQRAAWLAQFTAAMDLAYPGEEAA